MHKQQHHPLDVKTYQKGINSDSNKEILGSSQDGEHVDALNMRSLPMDGDNFAKKKIKGEEILYPFVDNRCNPTPPALTFVGYQCMMAQEVNEHIIEIWASTEPTEYPMIRIDGQIVLYSQDFPMDLQYPLQYDKNENCIGGEIYITNNNTPPLVFSVLDLLQNSGLEGGDCSEKYFSNFNPNNYTVPVSSTLFKPAFIKQDERNAIAGYDLVIGSNGLSIGSYSYSYRLVSSDGERTPFAPITELIQVVRKNGSDFDPQYPYSSVHGDTANIASSTNYGNHIRIKYQNDFGFVSLEIRRDSWYAEDPYGVPPVSEIIANQPIGVGLGILNVFDRAEAQYVDAEVLTLDEQSGTYSSIKRAKSIRYFNERLYLMNIGYNSTDIDNQVTFVDELGTTAFPTIENLGKVGHKNPYTTAMYKSNMRGDKTGFGVVLFDSYNNASYATKIPQLENFEFPNRRDIMSSDTQGTSYKGAVKAARVDGTIGLSHEVFDHYDASSKENNPLLSNSAKIQYQISDPVYSTLNPTSQNDSVSDLFISPNKAVSLDSTDPPGLNYEPKGFGLNYYSMGMALKGIETYPDWADGFSVVQTDPAKQVLAQGLGYYRIESADKAALPAFNMSKDINKFFAYFPDLEHRFPDVAQDLIDNPTNYSIQLVSPLGYFTEVYASRRVSNLELNRRGVDMITYARVLRDGSASVINPYYGENAGYSGVNDPDGFDYVAYGRFMNRTSTDSNAYPGNTNGNKIFPLDVSTSEVTTESGRQSYFEIAVDTSDPFHQDIYNSTTVGSDLDADAIGQYEWREPMYVINLYREADIPSTTTTQYKYTGNYVKFKSLVLDSIGSSNQSAILVSERWEDCIPQISGQVYNNYSSLKRFVYVEDEAGNEQRWMNIQFETAPDQATIKAGLAASAPGPYNDPILTGGEDIFGVYTSAETVDDLCPQYILNFIEDPLYTQFTVVPAGSKVYVKYDNRIPVRVFGGDTFINESIWAVLDNEYGNNGDPVNTASDFRWSNPFPFKQYDFNNDGAYPNNGYNWWATTKTSPSFPDIYGHREHQFAQGNSERAKVRQAVTMWTAETRCNLSYAYNIESPDKAVSEQYFPLINYIPRPYIWDISASAEDRTAWETANDLKSEYYDDYGFEWNLWKYGGFRFLPQVNIDYSKSQTTNIYTTVPQVGFEEQTEFCTRIIWSLRRPINIQNSPSVRTFPPSNYFDISDDTGEIKFAWSALSGNKGDNLYAFTNSGACLLLVDKRLLYELNGNELATSGSELGGILNQLWLDKTIGMTDETWRSWAEYSNSLFFTNGISAYQFTENQLIDIARTGFFDLLRTKYNSLIKEAFGSKMAGGFNVLTGEYVMNVLKPNKPLEDEFSTLIYGTEQKALQCQSSYNYDKYLYNKNKFYGMKGTGTYELGIGNQIDGEDIECYLSGVSDAMIITDKEFIRIRVNSNYKPQKIYFYKSYSDYKVDNYDSVVDADAIPLSIKDYNGYECYIPRSRFSPYLRNQGRVLIFKISSTDEEEFLTTSTSVQYKALK